MGFLRGLLESVIQTALEMLYTATGSLSQTSTNG